MDKQQSPTYPRDLGVMATEKQILLFSNLFGKFDKNFHVGASTDGLHFKKSVRNQGVVYYMHKGISQKYIEAFFRKKFM